MSNYWLRGFWGLFFYIKKRNLFLIHQNVKKANRLRNEQEKIKWEKEEEGIRQCWVKTMGAKAGKIAPSQLN